jgi:hypothetical protein
MELSDFRTVMDVHLMGSVHCTKAVWDIMREQNYGRIVMTTSPSGLYGNFGQSNYGSVKGGRYRAHERSCPGGAQARHSRQYALSDWLRLPSNRMHRRAFAECRVDAFVRQIAEYRLRMVLQRRHGEV